MKGKLQTEGTLIPYGIFGRVEFNVQTKFLAYYNLFPDEIIKVSPNAYKLVYYDTYQGNQEKQHYDSWILHEASQLYEPTRWQKERWKKNRKRQGIRG